MPQHIVTSVLQFKDDEMDGWEISVQTISSGRLQKRERVDEIAGWNIDVHPNDHPPPHIHCWKDGACLVVNLDEKLTYKVKGGKPKKNDIRRLRSRVRDNRDRYIECY